MPQDVCSVIETISRFWVRVGIVQHLAGFSISFRGSMKKFSQLAKK